MKKIYSDEYVSMDVSMLVCVNKYDYKDKEGLTLHAIQLEFRRSNTARTIEYPNEADRDEAYKAIISMMTEFDIENEVY